MKLGRTRERAKKLRAVDTLTREEESNRVDFAQLVLDKARILKEQIDIEGELSTDKTSLLYPVSAVRMLEEELGVDILGLEQENLMTQLSALLMTMSEEQRKEFATEIPRALPQVGWIQLFPEEFKKVELDDATFDAALHQVIRLKSDTNILPFVLILSILRPDRRKEMADLTDVDYFERTTWNERQGVFNSPQLGFFLGKYASFLLVHPEERPKFTLGGEEKQQLLQGIQAGKYPDSQTGPMLKNAMIVLAESAYIDERGKIQVEWIKPEMKQKAPLPVRSQM